jgi:orotate phosphoribosyltransferase
MDFNYKSNALDLLRKNSVLKGCFTLASGETTDYYLDTRLVSLSSPGLPAIADKFWQELYSLETLPDGVAGPTLGADPLVCGVLMTAASHGCNLKGGLVRKESKSHGTTRMVEGPLEPGDRVVVLEDVVTSGDSAVQAVHALREHGCVVERVICLVLRKSQGLAKLQSDGEVRVNVLFEAEELVGE